jgi:hypothetical protein
MAGLVERTCRLARRMADGMQRRPGQPGPLARVRGLPVRWWYL